MTQTLKVGTHKTTVSTSDSKTRVTYHATDVVTFDYAIIKLDSGGWFTNTTKLRMNQASNQFDLGFYVQQKNYEWYVWFMGNKYPFVRYNTLFLNRLSGLVTDFNGVRIDPIKE